MLGCGWVRTQQAPDFCRQYPLVTRHIAQRVADTTLHPSKPVKGGGVHVAYSGRPSGAHRRSRLLATDRHPGTAESRAAEAKCGHFESGASKRPLFETSHVLPLIALSA